MGTNEEKKEILEKLIADYADLKITPENQSQLYELLMDDTVNGKMYKYRAVDSEGWSLSAQESGKLYCSSPKAFNDPFDGHIGFLWNEYIEEISAGQPWKDEFSSFGAILEKVIEVLFGKFAIEMCNTDEQKIITKIQNTDRIMSVIISVKNRQLTQQEKQDLINKHGIEMLKIITLICEDEESAKKFPQMAKIIPEIVEKIYERGIFDLNLEHEPDTYAEFAEALGIQEDTDDLGIILILFQVLQLEQLKEAEQIIQSVNEAVNRMNGVLDSITRIGCLCTSNKNRLMWSHYADSHRGFCIEYDYTKWNREDNKFLPWPVCYSEKMPPFPFESMNDSNQRFTKKDLQFLIWVIFTKDHVWSYENEWRMANYVVNAETDYYADMPPISCVYLGANISRENEKKILEIAGRKNIPVRKMKLDRGTYELHIGPVSSEFSAPEAADPVQN